MCGSSDCSLAGVMAAQNAGRGMVSTVAFRALQAKGFDAAALGNPA